MTSCNCSKIMKQLQAVDSSRSRSPVKKNAKGKRVDSSKRLMIINAYKAKLEADPEKTIRTLRQEISKELGIGSTTISKTIMVYNRSKIVISPNRTRVKISARIIFEEFARNLVRRHVHSFWYKREIPTVDKIYQAVSNDDSLPPISRTGLFRLLKDMGFKYSKRSGNGALTEKSEIVLWRRRFLEDLRKYQKEGRHLYYLDETCINVGECTIQSPWDAHLEGQATAAVNASEEDKRVIVLNIGSEDGFVPGALLCFESKKKTRDFHDEISPKIFNNWMESVLPRLKKKCVIIMDNASYHSVKIDKAPSSKTEKADIINWLKDKNETIDRPMVIPQLLEMVKRVKPHHDKYVIDELAEQYDSIILRLPPYHCDLNAIELAWPLVKSYVSKNNTTFTLTDVKQLLIEGVEHVKPTMWKNFISQTKAEEEKLWKIDFIVDDVLSAEVLSNGDTSSDDSSIASD
ncbi:uncharacterized protein LOC100568659 [Acyrthosiphon pisum]|uniref:Tc1-like transposase DDE domain-containing protein n=1 Tax=Acyrthosiphon pisum TaxID=7029 RepID=A0A8R1W704_ACYPI|nr:uncharacterized protein LOC100568659 [Acyrthosiphon pisum]|eukprot:XP_003241398.1 PREDICTED: uncharacterized protein LOC100568659 [Acyrthosiphon pisum]